VSLDTEVNANDPADQLRADIESAYAFHEKGGEPEPIEPVAPGGDEPTEEPVVAADDRPRDEKGRFRAAEGAEEPAEPAEKPAEAKVEPPAAIEQAKVETRPPPGFSVASKAVWEDLPQSVRDDIAKREADIEAGFQRFSGLGKFAEEAERNGTTLQNAITDYDSIEKALKQNFVGGVEYICQRLGVDPRRLAGVMAQRYGVAAQTNGQAAPTTQAVQPQASFDPEALRQQFQQIARAEADARVQAMKAETERASIDRDIAAFGNDPKNKFFANVRQDMAALVQAGKANTLQEAYEAASWLNPEIRSILIKETNSGGKEAAAVASKARNAAKAVGGSPSPGAAPDASAKRNNLSLDDEIRAAVDAQIGQI
jgi:hypothetical protein